MNNYFILVLVYAASYVIIELTYQWFKTQDKKL